jgi:hypothetical protein
MVAERYGISEQTVWKWRGRSDVHDRSHTPHKLQTTLTPPQGSSVKRAIQWIDLHIDVKYLPQMADENRRRSLFVAIDRATRWVFVRN